MVAEAPATQTAEAQIAAPSAWAQEPTTVSQFEAMYDTVQSCPGRVATCSLKIVKVEPKTGAPPVDIQEGQKYKLFLVDSSDST